MISDGDSQTPTLILSLFVVVDLYEVWSRFDGARVLDISFYILSRIIP